MLRNTHGRVQECYQKVTFLTVFEKCLMPNDYYLKVYI